MNKVFAYLERSFWAVVWVLLAPLTADQLLSGMHVPQAYWFLAPILVALLAFVKNWVAKHTGDRQSLDFTNASAIKPPAK